MRRAIGLVRVRANDVFRHDGVIVNVNDVLLLPQDEARRLLAAGLVREDGAAEGWRRPLPTAGRWCEPMNR